MSQEMFVLQIEVRIKIKCCILLFWLLLVIVLLIVVWLIWISFDDCGLMIMIDFQFVNGIVLGWMLICYQGVEVGIVQDISFSKDLSKIEVLVSIKCDMKDVLCKEIQFWLVMLKVFLVGVLGFDVLVGGNYIGMMLGKGEFEDYFVVFDI